MHPRILAFPYSLVRSLPTLLCLSFAACFFCITWSETLKNIGSGRRWMSTRLVTHDSSLWANYHEFTQCFHRCEILALVSGFRHFVNLTRDIVNCCWWRGKSMHVQDWLGSTRDMPNFLLPEISKFLRSNVSLRHNFFRQSLHKSGCWWWLLWSQRRNWIPFDLKLKIHSIEVEFNRKIIKRNSMWEKDLIVLPTRIETC